MQRFTGSVIIHGHWTEASISPTLRAPVLTTCKSPMANIKSDADRIQRFIFEHSDIRGGIVTLEASYQEIIRHRNYPPAIANLLGEMLAAAGLMSATLKFDGVITLQARGDGPLSMIMVDCTRHHALRGLAQFDNSAIFTDDASLGQLIGKGHLAVTIDPAQGERYQGIVPLESASLSKCLEDYFSQSEQLPTRFWLEADQNRSGGLLLQALPRQLEAKNRQIWQHVTQLAETITAEEQLNLDQETLLFRLFHQDQLRLLGSTELQFKCSCSMERTRQALSSIGQEELLSIISELGEVTMDCHFCQHSYRFSEEDIKNIFFGQPPVLH